MFLFSDQGKKIKRTVAEMKNNCTLLRFRELELTGSELLGFFGNARLRDRGCIRRIIGEGDYIRVLQIQIDTKEEHATNVQPKRMKRRI